MSGSTLYGLPDCGLPCWHEIVLIANLTCFLYYVKPTSLHWNDLKFKYYNIFVQTSHDLALPCFSNLNFNHFPFTLASVPVRLPYPSSLTLFPLLACVQYQLKHVCLFAKLCLTLWRPHRYSLPGSSVNGISQARILEWVAMSFSRGSSWPRDRTHISCIGSWILYRWANITCFLKHLLTLFVFPQETFSMVSPAPQFCIKREHFFFFLNLLLTGLSAHLFLFSLHLA